jgi:hypothetical protein
MGAFSELQVVLVLLLTSLSELGGDISEIALRAQKSEEQDAGDAEQKETSDKKKRVHFGP